MSNSVEERLAKIETSVDFQGTQLSKILDILERIVVVEEHQHEQQRTNARLNKRIDVLQLEINTISADVEARKAVRKFVSWFLGLSGLGTIVMYVSSKLSG